jgi:hypothetical protein
VNRLQKFVEQRADGERSDRVAYAFGSANLPDAAAGMEWQADLAFNAAEEVLADDSLRAIFKEAIQAGIAIVNR